MMARIFVVYSRRARYTSSTSPVVFTSRELSGYFLVEAFQVLHRHADVEVVGARLEDVLPGARRLVGHDGIEVASKNSGRRKHRSDRLAGPERDPGAVLAAAPHGRRQTPRACTPGELARRQVVVGPTLIQNSLV